MTGYELSERMRKTRRRYPLTATEQALYNELVAICNEDQWQEVFSCSNEELCNALRISENTLDKARQTLILAGLVFYKSGKSKRQYSKYSFVRELTTSNFEVNKGVNAATNKGTNQGVNRGTNQGVNAADYIKSKTETKQNSLKEIFISVEKKEETIRAFISEHRPEFIQPYVDLWNLFAPANGFHESKVTKARINLFAQRICEKEFDFLKILDKAKDSKWVKKGNWFTIDWILKDDTNYVKLIEGNYDNPPADELFQEAVPGDQKKVLDSTQREINFLYDSYRENKERLTVLSLEVSLYHRLERDKRFAFTDDQEELINEKVIAYKPEAATNKDQFTRLRKLFAILEFFEQQTRFGIEEIYPE